jgi:hypothetical protein
MLGGLVWRKHSLPLLFGNITNLPSSQGLLGSSQLLPEDNRELSGLDCQQLQLSKTSSLM